jgi:hypothetical protein
MRAQRKPEKPSLPIPIIGLAAGALLWSLIILISGLLRRLL